MTEPWVVGYLLPNGALVCMHCSSSQPPMLLDTAMYTTDPEIAIDDADCDMCGERMLPPL